MRFRNIIGTSVRAVSDSGQIHNEDTNASKIAENHSGSSAPACFVENGSLSHMLKVGMLLECIEC